MPLQSQEQETLNVKLVHFTKQNSPDEPVQVAFSVVDDQGKEEIITGEIPYSYDLFRLLQEHNWLNIRRGCFVHPREPHTASGDVGIVSHAESESVGNPHFNTNLKY
jgi:hypothetical protein